MTEAEWLSCADPAAMLVFMTQSTFGPAGLEREQAGLFPPSDRKLRLFACACCRALWPDLHDINSRRAVEVAERFADGEATSEELDRAEQDAHTAWRGSDNPAGAARCCCLENITHAVQRIVAPDMRDLPQPATQATLLRDIVGNPFRPVPLLTCTVECDRCNGKGQRTLGRTCGTCGGSGKTQGTADWLTPTVAAIARAIYEQRAFADMPILADALEDAGCDNADLLAHLRGPGPHVLGCWALDLILGKE